MLEIELVEEPPMWLFYDIYEIWKKEVPFYSAVEIGRLLGDHIEKDHLMVWRGRGHHSQPYKLMSFAAIWRLKDESVVPWEDYEEDPNGSHAWVHFAWLDKDFRIPRKRKRGTPKKKRPDRVLSMNSPVVRAMYVDGAMKYPWMKTVGYYRALKKIQTKEDLTQENMRHVVVSASGATKGVLRRMYPDGKHQSQNAQREGVIPGPEAFHSADPTRSAPGARNGSFFKGSTAAH